MELAIVLIVMGLVLGAAMPSVLRYRQQAAIRETKERQELVTQAIAAYLALTGELPCPAEPGKKGEADSCGTEKKAIGVVPYRTLGLSEAQAKDAFGHFMTYAVPVIHNTIGGMPGQNKFCRMTPQIPLTILEKGVRATPEVPGPALDFVAIVLVSHGPAGASAESMSAEEQGNLDSTLVFHDRPYGSDDSSKPFRHIVKWVTARNLLGIYAKSPCTQQSEAPPHPSQPVFPPNPSGNPFYVKKDK